MEWTTNYSTIPEDFWKGRVDDVNDKDSYRWHQSVERIDLTTDISNLLKTGEQGFCIIGFSCDKGVENNLGRVGTAMGPFSIRKELANLPDNFSAVARIFDGGNIHCLDGNLDASQKALAEIVDKLLRNGLTPVVLGGGHEIAFGHYNGIVSYLDNSTNGVCNNLGIINFDAHFDMRPYTNGASSGTMFRQIADKCKDENREFAYLPVGIQRYGNTKSLFNIADELGVKYLLAKDIYEANWGVISRLIDEFLYKKEHIYLTICSDVFSSAFAPGVSAPQPFGLHPEITLRIIKHIIQSGKLLSFDIAEVSPRFDEDNHTAKLASILIYGMINTILNDDK